MSPFPADRLRVRIEQFAPRLANPEHNLERIRSAQTRAAADGVDLLVTPELSVTGYDLKDLTRTVARALGEPPFPELESRPDTIVGFVERDPGFVPFNSAVHLRGGAVLHRHRKVYLPTYGMFDEGRYFGAGTRARTYDGGGGWRLGLLVCEDLWHPSLPYLLAMGGANLLVVQSAAAGRGTWEGRGAGRFASWATWEHLAIAAAAAYGIYVVVANRVGVEGSMVFSGGSFIVGPNGAVLGRADDLEEDRVTGDLSLAQVARARAPFAHLRDEDPHLVMRELARLAEEDPP